MKRVCLFVVAILFAAPALPASKPFWGGGAVDMKNNWTISIVKDEKLSPTLHRVITRYEFAWKKSRQAQFSVECDRSKPGVIGEGTAYTAIDLTNDLPAKWDVLVYQLWSSVCGGPVPWSPYEP